MPPLDRSVLHDTASIVNVLVCAGNHELVAVVSFSVICVFFILMQGSHAARTYLALVVDVSDDNACSIELLG